ncbi:AMP-binding protein [Streptomyces sp. NPDC001985]|uniref:non-ribosomal peptide synthetase n=1 Tax=Streptomyces sp. NPDC001985 TaxID=3154406 RepID=UPI00332332D4
MTFVDGLRERFRLYETSTPTSVNHIAVALRLPETADAAALHRALAALAVRHPHLTGSARETDEGRLVLTPGGPPRVETASAASRTAAEALVGERARHPLDTASGPLLRALVVRTPEGPVLGLTGHRLVLDHAAIPALLAEVAESLRTGAAGPAGPARPEAVAPDPPPVPVDEVHARIARELADCPPVVDLPTRIPRRGAAVGAVSHHDVPIPTALAARVESLARSLGTPVETVLLAALHALLHRYGGQERLMVGVALDRRRHGPVVGSHTDLVPVATRLTRATTFGGLVTETARQRADAARGPAVPVGVLAGLFRRSDDESPLPNVAFAVRPAPRLPEGWTGGFLDPAESEFDLELTVETAPLPRTARFSYRTALHDPGPMAALARHYLTLLDAAVTRPDVPVRTLDMLSDDDLAAFRGDPRKAAEVRERARPVHRWVEEHAAARPGALAIGRGADRMTYGELNRTANRLARELRVRGVGREDVVGICLESSPGWLVGVLAAFKLGALPVPLDTNAPPARLELAVAASPPVVIIGRSGTVRGLPESGAALLLLDRDGPAIDRHADADLDEPIGIDDLGYIIQTSGSTGRPKAILSPHRVLSLSCAHLLEVNRTTAADRGTWLAPPGSGISFYEVGTLLAAGGSLHIPERDTVASPPLLRDWMVEHRITQSFMVAPIADAIQSLRWPAGAALRTVVVGGDKLHRWAPPDVPFSISPPFGSSEAMQITSPTHPWTGGPTPATATAADRAWPPPVGSPAPMARVYVLDDDQRPVPPGAVGELWVGGDGVVLGYLGDPEGTAATFRPDPFGPPGSRMYRTGDLGRYRPDGLLDHRGRAGSMLKIKGYRVETGDVEAALLTHPGISLAAVIPVTGPGSRPQLVACVTSREPVTPLELREYVAERLPEYMVPVAYVVLDTMPSNASNKIDRSRLPPPGWEDWRPSRPYRQPADTVERALAGLWAEVLGVERVGVDDSFFELGGSSLQASTLITMVQDRMPVRLSLRQLFLLPTPAGLAGLIKSDGARGTAPALPAVTPLRGT